MSKKGYSLEEAYKYVKARRSVISPNLHFMGQLLDWEREISSFKSSKSPEKLSPSTSSQRCLFSYSAIKATPDSRTKSLHQNNCFVTVSTPTWCELCLLYSLNYGTRNVFVLESTEVSLLWQIICYVPIHTFIRKGCIKIRWRGKCVFWFESSKNESTMKKVRSYCICTFCFSFICNIFVNISWNIHVCLKGKKLIITTI